MDVRKELAYEFEVFNKYITRDDIDYFNKLNELSDKISNELYHMLDNTFMELKIYEYIKEHLYAYKYEIIDETIRIKDEWQCTTTYLLNSGLYNMDELYLKAIAYNLKTCLEQLKEIL